MRTIKALMALIISASALMSCQSGTEVPVYTAGRTWTFSLKNSDSTRVDTLTLKVLDESWMVMQTKIIWGQVFRDANGKTVSEEHTGVIDRSTSLILNRHIWLHPYRSNAMRLTELVSFPQVYFPIHNGQVVQSTITPKQGWKELEGITVKGRLAVSGKVAYQLAVLKDSCWKMLATGTSEAGKYSGTFYYHPTKGFVYFYYDFKKYTCEVDLVKTNF